MTYVLLLTMALLGNDKRWRSIRLISIIFLVVFVRLVAVGKHLLSESVAYYELLDYPQSAIPHARVRKSLHPNDELRLELTAHGRTFKLGLKKDTSLFSDDLLITDNDELFDTSNIYAGKLIDEPGSSVHGFVHDRIFEGRIHCSDGNEFEIESAKQYDGFDKEKAHSVIYNIRDLIHSQPYYYGVVDAKPDLKTGRPGSKPDTKNYEYSVKRMAIDLSPNYDAVMPDKNHDKRLRRAVDSIPPPRKLECQIQIRADPRYVEYAKGNKNRAMYLMTQHIKFVQNMLETTDFNDDGIPDGYTIVVKKIGVIDTSRCTTNSTSTDCKFKDDHVGVAKFLDVLSTDDHSPFCLSYVFTHRNFDRGILGLAFTGSSTNEYPGGICEKYKIYEDGKKKTLNTGVVSNTVYGQTVMKKETDITFAHEIAHNFGSGHDRKTNPTCVPKGSGGNYLMYSQAQDGSEKNNVVLSPCSKASMWKNLQAKSDICFHVKGEPICGNRIVEPGEDCDCGYASEDSCYRDDPCCLGAQLGNSYFGCKWSRKAGKRPAETRCSPSLGECCNRKTCQPFANNTKECSRTECTKASKCISTSPKCQPHEAIPDRSLCNGDSNICVEGECSGSLCILANKLDCQCSAEDNRCKLCCQNTGNASSCAVYKFNGQAVKRTTGSPCNQGNGRCDILSKCQDVNENGILGRLKNWLFSHPTFVNIYEWAKVNWWACILMVLGLVLFIIGFVWCCQQFVPSDGKGKRNPGRPFLCVNTLPEERPVSPSAPSNTSSSRNYVRTPTSDPPHYDDPPPGYSTAVRDTMRYPPSYELEIMR